MYPYTMVVSLYNIIDVQTRGGEFSLLTRKEKNISNSGFRHGKEANTRMTVYRAGIKHFVFLHTRRRRLSRYRKTLGRQNQHKYRRLLFFSSIIFNNNNFYYYHIYVSCIAPPFCHAVFKRPRKIAIDLLSGLLLQKTFDRQKPPPPPHTHDRRVCVVCINIVKRIMSLFYALTTNRIDVCEL